MCGKYHMSTKALGSQSDSKRNNIHLAFISTDTHLKTDFFAENHHERSACRVLPYMKPWDWILPNADKPSLLDKREFSLRVALSESSQFNGNIYLTYQRDLFNNFDGLSGGSYLGSCQLRLKGNSSSHWSATTLKCHTYTSILFENIYSLFAAVLSGFRQ